MAVPVPPPLPAPLETGPQLSDRWILALAGAVAVGAWVHRPVPLAVTVLLTAIALGVRRPFAIVVAGWLLASALGARSFDGLQPVEPGAFEGTVTLVADPSPLPFGSKVDVRLGHRRVELWAAGSAAGAVERSLAGEQLQVSGRLSRPPPGSPWLVPRHVVGKLTVDRAERSGQGSAPWRAANQFRRLLQRGSEPIPEPARSLYAGFVLGDDRTQPPEIVDDFRGAGLTHLLVVSGQNVAFVLVLLAPVIERIGWRGRWCATLAVIGAFGVVTRFEPSVLRASAMAAIAVTAGALGRPSGAVRTLALATAALVLIDPLLVRSVGFQLSVGASLAIASLAERLASALPGPRPVARALGVTLAAQVGVAPVLIPRFGGIPVASLVTNLLAVPVAGLVTTWGLPAGVIAGAAGGWPAQVLHLPTRLLIGWVEAVARTGASLPLGEVRAPHLLARVALGAIVVGAGRGAVRRTALVGGVAVLALPSLALTDPASVVRAPGGATIYRAGGATVVLVPTRPRVEDLFQDLRRAGVRQIDVLVVDAARPGEVARSLRHRWRIGRILDARSGPPAALRVGAITVRVSPPHPPEISARSP